MTANYYLVIGPDEHAANPIPITFDGLMYRVTIDDQSYCAQTEEVLIAGLLSSSVQLAKDV